MNVSDMLDELSDYGFTDTPIVRKLNHINYAIRDICGREPWPFLEASQTLNFDGTNDTPTNMPSNIRAVLRITEVATGRRLFPVRLDDLEDGYAAQLTTVSAPQVYWWEGGTLNFTPIPPAATGAYRLRYLKTHPTVSADTAESSILIPANHHELIVLGALIRLNDMEDDPEVAVRFEQRQEKLIDAMREEVWKQQYDSPDYIRPVTDNYDWDYYYLG